MIVSDVCVICGHTRQLHITRRVLDRAASSRLLLLLPDLLQPVLLQLRAASAVRPSQAGARLQQVLRLPRDAVHRWWRHTAMRRRCASRRFVCLLYCSNSYCTQFDVDVMCKTRLDWYHMTSHVHCILTAESQCVPCVFLSIIVINNSSHAPNKACRVLHFI